METFVVYADWRAAEPVAEAALEAVNRAFRPEDESACVWIGKRNS